ncbi:MAG: hypothetical protein HGB37_02945 [Candidatus Moranbacteria bacterium]|nr:hypothetical protein [Candidatus Moranbacteria bacterium]
MESFIRAILEIDPFRCAPNIRAPKKYEAAKGRDNHATKGRGKKRHAKNHFRASTVKYKTSSAKNDTMLMTVEKMSDTLLKNTVMFNKISFL